MVLVLPLCLAAFFLATAVAKIRRPAGFIDVLTDVFPDRAVNIVRWSTVGAEFFIAATLLAGFSAVAAPLGIIFLGASSSVIAVRFSKRDDFKCGCWGAELPQSLSTIANRARYVPTLDTTAKGASVELAKTVRFTIQNMLLLQGLGWLWSMSGGSRGPLLHIALLAMVPLVLCAGLAVDIAQRRRLLRLPIHPLRQLYVTRAAPLIAMTWYLPESRQPAGGQWIVSGNWSRN
jgi:hypothetical protein